MRRRIALILLLCTVLLSLTPLSAQEDAQPDTVSVLQVVDSDPLSGEEISGQDAVTVYFDRELDCDTVNDAAAISPEISGDFACEGTTLTFTPSEAYQRDMTYTITLSDALRGADGSQLLETYMLQLSTAGALRVTNTLPTEDAAEVVSDTVLTIIFNRPVVPLGVPSDAPDLPNPLTIEPAIEGTGEWLNTSIYTFTPEDAWGGGTTYTVTVDNLTAVDGTALAEPYTFSFTVALPQVLTVVPETGADTIRLNTSMQMTFNQPIDQESLEANFYLRPQGTNSAVEGEFEWNEDSTGFMFTPSQLLQLDTLYEYGFNAVQSGNSEASISPYNATFRTVPLPAITGTDPADESEVRPYGGFTLYFASPMNPETLRDTITIEPAPPIEPDFFYQEWSNSYAVTFSAEPATTYTITVAPGMEDVYGNPIEESFTFRYTTGNYDPELNLQVPSGPIGFYDAGRDTTGLFITHRNVSAVNLDLYNVPLLDFIGALGQNQYYNLSGIYAPRSQDLLRSWQIDSIAPPNVLRYELLDLGNPDSGETVDRSTNPIDCVGAIPTRTQIGDRAVVTTEPDPLRARATPPDGEIVDLLYAGYVFTVVEGPVCANDILWWGIELRDGQTAWVAEGLTDEYFFEVTVPAEITPEPPQSTIELEGGALPPGVYMLALNAPETQTLGFNDQRHFLVVGTANLTMKAGIDEVTVWATDVRSGEPLADVEISLYGISDVTIAENTDEQGVARFEVPRLADLYIPLTAVLDDGTNYGVGFSEWAESIDPWRFNLNYNYYPQTYTTYLYTERPVYRPGQPVYFRGIVRQRDDINYNVPDLETVPVKIFDSQGNTVYETQAELTEYGTFSLIYDLAEDTPLGYYNISVELPAAGRFGFEGGSVGFDVAEYRLPEYQVNLTPEQPQVVQGETIRVMVDAEFFFGGPVVNATVDYTVSSSGYFFDYDGSGSYSFYDLTRDDGGVGGLPYFDPFYGESIAKGSGITDGNGQFVIEVPAELLEEGRSATWTIEANVRDNTGQTVSGRTSMIVHQSLVYAGVAPEQYVGTAGDSMTVNVIAVDWGSQPIANQDIQVEVVERRWSSVQTLDRTSGDITYEYEVEEIPVEDGTVTTDSNGKATFDFIPPNGGVYQATVTTTDENGNTSVASNTIWVSSESYIAWRIDNNNRIDLIADRDQYEIGDTARILITSPFQGEAEALITVERGGVLMTDRITLDSNSATYELPITEDYAPNVYFSVFIVKGVDETNPVASFRMGIIGLQVNNERKQLTINIEPDTELAGPGDTVTYTLTTSNYLNQPVQAEVGVALTDLASLSIGIPYAGPILEAFYGLQALGIRTSSPLTINTDYITQFVLDVIKGGGGGGGGGGVFEIREEFLDTAYWNASLVTDENGTATFEVTLPDNLTTWRLDARGVTSGEDGDLLVGQDTFDLLATKPVLVRPVTPRFFVVGDEVVLAAVVNNNSGEAQEVEVRIEAEGVTLQSDAAQTVTILDGSSARVEWNVTVDDSDSVELVFSAEAGEFTDATRPTVSQGEALPVYRYEAPETVGTGGLLREAGTREERIVLPERFAVETAEVTVSLDLSLAAAMTQSLEYLRSYPNQSIESTVSAFLPNVVTSRVFAEFDLQNVEFTDELEGAVNLAIQRLAAQQKPDGGWGWYVQDESNPLVTAWALIGLVEAQEAGFTVDQNIINRAVAYLQTQVTTRNAPGGDRGRFIRDRQVFMLYALYRADAPDNAAMSNLYEQRDLLSIYAKAMLALALEGDLTRVNALLDDIFADAITSANGVHWEEASRDRFGWNSNTRTTAIVLMALARYRPENDLVPNVVRWLMVARRGDAWETTQETAWAVMGLSEWLRVSGELEASYPYSATYNGESLIDAEASADDVLNTQVFTLDAEQTNSLEITRGEGEGSLYYTAYLEAFLPVPEIEPINRGIIVQREYRVDGEIVTEARVGDIVEVRLTVIAPNDLYYVVVDDPLPAGAEGIDTGLATSQQTGTQPGVIPVEGDPLSRGWGWWYFSNIEFRDEKVVLNATYLPAGTYQYVYSIRAGVEGTYNVIPTTAREFYFPEVYGRGAGSVFSILPDAE